jgi:hypothetical protein
MPREVKPERGRYPEPVEVSAHSVRRHRVAVVVSVDRSVLEGADQIDRWTTLLGERVVHALHDAASPPDVLDAGEVRFDPDDPNDVDPIPEDVRRDEDV